MKKPNLNHLKRYLWVFILLITTNFYAWSQVVDIDQVVDSLRKNVVAIKAKFSDGTEERGFGFITSEIRTSQFSVNTSLYLATAAHVIKGHNLDKTAQSIQILFYNDPTWYVAREVRSWKDDIDLALLVLQRPYYLTQVVTYKKEKKERPPLLCSYHTTNYGGQYEIFHGCNLHHNFGYAASDAP
ncbi:hypothetical protein [Haliscomenobacter hydrossis]|uniref:hypothetical protein n=1 Tax=Haliscomenobacter hydrossis TaxID=2350 RepID=UPI0005C615A8|nr:hypothetical protein [Haliscomenobacter hydrossis]